MTDYVKLSNRGPLSRSLEFALGVVVGFLLANGYGCKVPEGAEVGITCDDQGCRVHASGDVPVDAAGNIAWPAPADDGE